MRKASSTAQPRQGRGLAVASVRTAAVGSTEWAAGPLGSLARAGRAAARGWRRRLVARPCCV
jgi:hypothetical protein